MPIRLNFFRVLPCSALFLGTSGVREGRLVRRGGRRLGSEDEDIRRWDGGWEKGREGRRKERKGRMKFI